MSASFYWHDYETTGISPALDRPVQFAGIRTDDELNIIGEPLRLYCRLPQDILPHPRACAVTGISPQQANALGLSEREFIGQIHAEMMQPGTCSVGYNSIRFDDEFTRYTLYRNYFDAYEREYRNGNSRWDLIDVTRLCCALRPDDIEWPSNEDGRPSFRLELLSQANGIEHEDAHDALADVYATIELARLLKQRKPRLFDYTLQLRNKRFVAKMLDTAAAEPLLHVSSKLPSEFYCATLVAPLAKHPGNANGVICADLRYDPQILFDSSAADLHRYLFMPAAERDERTPHVPLKTIHLNRSPMLGTQKLLDDSAAERIQLDPALCQRNFDKLRKNTAWLAKLERIFAGPEYAADADVDTQLYGGGFFSDADRYLMQKLRQSGADGVGESSFAFEDDRLSRMLFRYRARNFPDSLTQEDKAAWKQHCCQRLSDAQGFGFQQFDAELAGLREEPGADTSLVDQLADYAHELQAWLES